MSRAETKNSAVTKQPDLARWLLQQEIADFLFAEAELLDERRFRDWLNLLEDDISYFMPIRRNVQFGQQSELENTVSGEGISWFDDDKWTLTKRVEQILTGTHFAEEPLSRVCHLISNVRLASVSPNVEEAQEVTANSCFLVYQNRQAYETNIFAGKRKDVLHRTVSGWKIAKRRILLDQNVLLAKNLTIFF
jgi:3-phenylpropionate/cinnamic acid dioxygenase small subunit